MTNYIIS